MQLGEVARLRVKYLIQIAWFQNGSMLSRQPVVCNQYSILVYQLKHVLNSFFGFLHFVAYSFAPVTKICSNLCIIWPKIFFLSNLVKSEWFKNVLF